MATTQPINDEMDMRALMNDTMTKLGVKTTPLTVPAPAATLGDTPPKPPLTRQEQLLGAGLGIVLLIIASILWSRWQATAPTAPPVPLQTAVSTFQPTSAPTAAPAPAAALVGYFDYRDPASVAPISASQIMRVVGQASDNWRLVDVGSARVWIPTEQVPTGIPAADPLPDLTPRRPVPIAPAPVVQPVSAPVASPAPCTQAIAPYVVHRQVQAGTLPIGEVTGWSCTSAAEAEASAATQEQQVHASYQATTTTKTSEATR
jgi:hypothetical protein